MESQSLWEATILAICTILLASTVASALTHYGMVTAPVFLIDSPGFIATWSNSIQMTSKFESAGDKPKIRKTF